MDSLALFSPPMHGAIHDEPLAIWEKALGYFVVNNKRIQRNICVSSQNAAEMTKEGDIREEGTIEQLDPGDVGWRHSNSSSTMKRNQHHYKEEGPAL